MNTLSDVTFSTYPHTAKLELAVQQYRAGDAPNTPHIMFCGGFHSAMMGTKASELLTLCTEHGWHFTRFDYRGHGQSGGLPADFTLADWLDDTLAVLDQTALPTLLVGSSMGAWIATLAALRRPSSIHALLLVAAAPDFLQELVAPNLSAGDIWDLQQGASIDLPNDYDQPHPVTQALLDSGKALSLLSDASDLGALQCPMRLVHGTADTVVPYDFSVRLMKQLPPSHDARLSLLHDADHRLSDPASLTYIFKTLTALVAELEETAKMPNT